MLLKLAGKARSGLRFNEHLDGDRAVIITDACRLGADGIVSKLRDRPYRSGRSHGWLKIKNPASPAVHRIEEGAGRSSPQRDCRYGGSYRNRTAVSVRLGGA
jgi:ATP-dependent DNA ligase